MRKELLESMNKLSQRDDITIPPLSMVDLGGEIIDYKEAKFLKTSFPIKEKYNNPMNITLGGYYAMFFDLTYGPFSFMELQGPSISLDLNVSFIKPITTDTIRILLLKQE